MNPDFTDEELAAVTTSVSVTYGVLVAKLKRTTGDRHREALVNYNRIESALAKCQDAQKARINAA